MTYLEQNEATGRHIFPDLVRAFALFGIVLVNVAYFGWPGEITYFYGGLETEMDVAASFAIDTVFLFKSYTLFSFMFGAGLAYQMMSAERRGVAFAPRYFRRMLGLIVLGVLHVTFAFVGDILIIYAIIGILLFVFRNRPVKSLLRWAFAFLIVQILISFLFAIMLQLGESFDPDSMAVMEREIGESMDQGALIYQTGGFAEIASRRWTEWQSYIVFAGSVQGPGVLSFFLFGLASVKSGIMKTPSALIWTTSRRIYLPIGVILSLVGAWVLHESGNPMSGKGSLGTAIILIGAPLSSLGYMGWIAKWSEGPVKGFRLFMARAGTTSLTTYLLQSLILSFVFCNYGLGLYGQIGAAGCVAIAAATGAVTLSLTSFWRTRFERGPFEWVLRKWTYLGAR